MFNQRLVILGNDLKAGEAIKSRLIKWGLHVTGWFGFDVDIGSMIALQKPDAVIIDLTDNDCWGEARLQTAMEEIELPVVYLMNSESDVTDFKPRCAPSSCCLAQPFSQQQFRTCLRAAMDIHDRIRDERSENDLLKRILTCMEEGVIVTDSDLRIVMANRKAGQLMGIDPDSCKHQHLYNVFVLIEMATREIVTDTFDEVLENGNSIGPVNNRCLLSSDHKEIPIKYWVHSIIGGNQTAKLIITFLDIREQREILDELGRSNQKILSQQKALLEEERLKSMIQVAGTAVYELNQPLTVLLGNVELMEMNQNDPEKLKHHIRRIKEAGRSVEDIVQRIHAIRAEKLIPLFDTPPALSGKRELNILMVEDSDLDFKIIEAILKKFPQVTLSWETTIEKAVNRLIKETFDLIFLDYLLPDGDGLNFLRTLDRMGIDTPVVIITAVDGEIFASQAIQHGAYDYLIKGKVSSAVLSRVINNTLAKSLLVQEANKMRKKMIEISNKDEKTGLFNHRFFIETLDREISRAKRYGTNLNLCVIEVVNMDSIIDLAGYRAADKVLTEVGALLKENHRKSDIACRCGEDKFALVFPHAQPDQIHKACQRLKYMITSKTFEFGTYQFHVELNMGIAHYKRHDVESANQFMELANRALYQTPK